MTRVLIVDDERNILKAYEADIRGASDRYELADSLTHAADAVLACSRGDVDLVILDINTARGESGIEAAAKLRKNWPDLKIIIATSYADPYAPRQAREAGADSFWYKDHSPVDLLEVMDAVMAGSGYWPEDAPVVGLGRIESSALTDAEVEVLHALVECVSIRRIAEKLFIEESTVKSHLKNICNKVGCGSKTELLILLMEAKFVLPPRR